MTPQEYSEQNPGNLRLCKITWFLQKMHCKEKREISGELQRNLEKYQPVTVYGPYLDPNLGEPNINKHS